MADSFLLNIIFPKEKHNKQKYLILDTQKSIFINEKFENTSRKSVWLQFFIFRSVEIICYYEINKYSGHSEIF